MEHPHIHDALRLSKDEQERIIARLNRRAEGSARSRRTTNRWVLVPQRSLLTIDEGSAGRVHFVIVPRNISRTGVAFLHGAFLHKGTRCMVTLRQADGATRQLAATVARCSHIDKRIHDVGVALDEEIDPNEFGIRVHDEYMFQRECADPASLTGSVLLVAENAQSVREVERAFEGTGVTLAVAGSGAAGLSMLENNPGMVLLDAALADMKGLDWIIRAREADSGAPIVVLSNKGEQGDRLEAIAAGASEMLFRPFKRDLLLRAAAELLTSGRDVNAPAMSDTALDVPDKMGIHEARGVLTELRRIGRIIEAAAAEDDLPTVQRLAVQVRGTAETFELHTVLSVADEAHRALSQAKALSEAMSDVKHLICLCEQVRLKPPPAKPPEPAKADEEGHDDAG